METPATAQRIPWILAAVAAAAGLGLALAGGLGAPDAPAPETRATAPPPAPPDATASGTTDAPAAEPERYTPDLSGDDIGKVIVAQGADAHGLAVVGKRLVWFQTDGARLSSAELDGSGVVALHHIDAEDRFGGAFAADGRQVYFTVAGGDGEPIYRAAAAALDAPLPSEPPFAHAGSPSALAPLEGALFWADRGSLYDASGKISARDKRIVSLVGCQRVLFWIEAPYDGAGPHELWAKALTGSPGRVRAGLSPSERELVCAGRFIAWADDDGVQVIASEGGRPFVRAKATGVQNLAYRDGRLWWSEAHGEGDDAVSIFRSVPAEGGEVLRLGRTSGYVSALYVHVAYLYWSGPRGIARAPIPTAEPIH